MSDNNNRVMVLLLTCNQLGFTRDCIESVIKSDYPDFEIVVIDNGSSDGTHEALKSEYPEITVIKNERNLGVGGGRNIGLCHFLNNSKSRYLYILDNDTVIDKHVISELVGLMEKDKRIGIAAGFLYYFSDPEVIHIAGGAFHNWKKGLFYGSMRGEKTGRKEIEREVEEVVGATIFTKREVVEKTGLFHEEYFYGREDSDWSYRAAKFGYRFMATSRARILHKVSQSMGMESPYFYYYNTR
ncbi:glycosyltransferase family 2 protein, partial [Candidatus Auribacterota bacterium]